MHFQLAGYYSVRKYRIIDGKEVVTLDLPMRKNLIVNTGLDQIATTGAWSTIFGSCKVGSGSVAPANGDTALGNVLLTNSSVKDTGGGRSVVSPFYGYYRRTYVFDTGTGEHSLNEMGIFQSSTMFCRALFLDEDDELVTILKLDDEVMEVVWSLFIYPPDEVAVNVGSIFLKEDKDGPDIEHEYWVVPRWSDLWPGELSTVRWATAGISYFETSSDITALTIPNLPTASSESTTVHSASYSAYVAGSFYLDYIVEWDQTQGNYATGMGGIRLNGPFPGRVWHLQLIPSIGKHEDVRMRLTFRFSWGRAE